MSELNIDAEAFKARVELLHGKYREFENEPNSMVFALGSSNPENPYQKTTALHYWLMGYEFPATLIVFTPGKVVIITSGPKAKHLEKVVELFKNNNNGVELEIWQRNNKDVEHSQKLFKDIIELINTAGKTVGIPEKDVYEGKFMKEWKPIWDAAIKEHEFKLVDISAGLSSTWEVKDDKEKAYISIASKCSDRFMNLLSDEMVRAVDDELKITNSKLSDKIENKIDDLKFLKKITNDLSAMCPPNHKFPKCF